MVEHYEIGPCIFFGAKQRGHRIENLYLTRSRVMKEVSPTRAVRNGF